VNRSILLVALLGLLAASLTRAEEPSACTSMCTSEKDQCMVRAGKLTELDKMPRVEETNPFARTSNEGGGASSTASVTTDRLAAQRRSQERVGACNASYKRCNSACAPAAAPGAEQVAPAK
jgi:hypothetical protein